MSTEELKTFICLTKVKNFTIAAEQLSVAQSTVTNRIVELEKEVGKRLFNRGPKSVVLTEAGKIFLSFAERIIELQEASVEEMNAASAYRQKITVGAINATYEVYVKPLLDECLKKTSDVSVNVVIGHSLDLIRSLQDNLIDLVFSSVPMKRAGIECREYDADRLVLVGKKGLCPTPDGVYCQDLPKMQILMCGFMSDVGVFINSLFPANHVFKLTTDNSSKILSYVLEGLGFTFLPYKLVKNDVESGLLEEIPLLDVTAPKFVTYLIYKKGFDPNTFLKYRGKN